MDSLFSPINLFRSQKINDDIVSLWTEFAPPFLQLFIMTDRPKSAATKPKQVSVIGYYEMDKNIGEGNFAKVRLAKHMITKQEVNASKPGCY